VSCRKSNSKNAEVLFLAEPVDNPVCLHVSIGPKSVAKYQEYYEQHIASGKSKPENKKGQFNWLLALGGAAALVAAMKFKVGSANNLRRQRQIRRRDYGN